MNIQQTFRGFLMGLRETFIAHPHETGETYLEHLWFTFSMAMRFAFVSAVILIHGLFPFLMVHTASRRIEKIYGIIKNRGAKAPQNPAYLDYSV